MRHVGPESDLSSIPGQGRRGKPRPEVSLLAPAAKRGIFSLPPSHSLSFPDLVSAPVRVSVRVNGTHYDRQAEPRLLLSDFLRHDLGLTGTHVGCEHGVCGACTVLLDAEPVRSCLLFARGCLSLPGWPWHYHLVGIAVEGASPERGRNTVKSKE